MGIPQPNTNSDDAFLLAIPQDSAAYILKQLQVITIILREGLNIPDETSQISQQPVPFLNPTIVVTTTP